MNGHRTLLTMASADASVKIGPLFGTSEWYKSREEEKLLLVLMRFHSGDGLDAGHFPHWFEGLGWPWFALTFPSFLFSGKKVKPLNEFHAPNAGSPDSSPGWGTRSHMPQLKILLQQLRLDVVKKKLKNRMEMKLLKIEEEEKKIKDCLLTAYYIPGTVLGKFSKVSFV